MEIYARTVQKECNALMHVYVLQMTSIRMLREHAKTGASAYTTFKATRIEDRSKLQIPFEQLNSKEIMSMIYKWLCEQGGNVATLQLRMHDRSGAIMHYVGIRANR